MSRGQDQFMLRLPEGMRDAITVAAKAADRSMNTEIVRRLKGSFGDLLPEESAMPADRHQAPSYPLRISDDLRASIGAVAQDEGRSLHAEIVKRLEASVVSPAAVDGDRYTRITLRIPKELHREMDAEAECTSKSLNAAIVARLEAKPASVDRLALAAMAMQAVITRQGSFGGSDVSRAFKAADDLLFYAAEGGKP